MNKKTIAIFAVCMVLVAALSVMGTIAYLTSKTNTVTNTFTSGNVTITLDETMMNADGTAVATGDTRFDGTNGVGTDPTKNLYKLYPTESYTKDPKITVGAGSEDCYIGAVIIVNNTDKLTKFAGTGAETAANFLSYLSIDVNTGWVIDKKEAIDTNNDSIDDAYLYTVYNPAKFTSSDVKQESTIFDSFTVPGSITNEQLAELNQLNITVTGYAVQATGFESDVTPSLAALKGAFSNPFETYTNA